MKVLKLILKKLGLASKSRDFNDSINQIKQRDNRILHRLSRGERF